MLHVCVSHNTETLDYRTNQTVRCISRSINKNQIHGNITMHGPSRYTWHIIITSASHTHIGQKLWDVTKASTDETIISGNDRNYTHESHMLTLRGRSHRKLFSNTRGASGFAFSNMKSVFWLIEFNYKTTKE